MYIVVLQGENCVAFTSPTKQMSEFSLSIEKINVQSFFQLGRTLELFSAGKIEFR